MTSEAAEVLPRISSWIHDLNGKKINWIFYNLKSIIIQLSNLK